MQQFIHYLHPNETRKGLLVGAETQMATKSEIVFLITCKTVLPLIPLCHSDTRLAA